MDLINPPNLIKDHQFNTKQAIHYQLEWSQDLRKEDRTRTQSW